MELEEIFDMPQDNNMDMIAQLEERFHVTLPEDYKFFLLKYGSGGMGNFEFLGIESEKMDISKCTIELMTAQCREKGMPKNLVVIEHHGDYVTCIETMDFEEQIVTWSWLDSGQVTIKADNFETYFAEKLADYL